MSSKGDERGQVTMGRITEAFVPAPHRRSLAGALRDEVTKRPRDETWSAVRDAAESAPYPDRRA